MTQLTTLDAAEITTWLTRVTQTIDRSLREVFDGGLGRIGDFE